MFREALINENVLGVHARNSLEIFDPVGLVELSRQRHLSLRMNGMHHVPFDLQRDLGSSGRVEPQHSGIDADVLSVVARLDDSLGGRVSHDHPTSLQVGEDALDDRLDGLLRRAEQRNLREPPVLNRAIRLKGNALFDGVLAR